MNNNDLQTRAYNLQTRSKQLIIELSNFAFLSKFIIPI